MDVDIKGLINKLNGPSRRALEAAAGNCVSRGHYEVTVEHLLLQFLEDPAGDVQAILRHFEINPAALLRTVQHVLERVRAGNTGRPVFSPLLLGWIQDAWLTVSVDYGDDRVRSGGLLLALVQKPDRFTDEDLSGYLEPIRKDELKRDLYRITASSSEHEAVGEGEPRPQGPARPADETAIGRFMIDFTDRARKGEIDPVFGRDREIRQMIDILARRRKNNPIVVGEPGVGKTAVVEGLALRIVEGDVPDVLKNVRLLSLDLGLLQAGAGVKGEFENRLKAVITEVKASPTPIVTFIDEAHTLIGAGGSAGGSDAANLLKPALARGELRTIAATTWSEYKKYFEKDAALERRFQVVKLDEPSEEDAILMMRGLREKYEEAHGVRIRDEAVEAAARLSSRYISGRQLPDKAVDLLDTAAARVKIAQATKPEAGGRPGAAACRRSSASATRSTEDEDLAARGRSARPAREALTRELIARVEDAKPSKEMRPTPLGGGAAKRSTQRCRLWPRPRFLGEDRAGRAAGGRSRAETGCGPAPRWPKLQGANPLVPLDVDAACSSRPWSASWTGIPVGKMIRDEAALVLDFRDRMAERIKGQDQAPSKRSIAGFGPPAPGSRTRSTPIGVFLFVGPSGVGKTETALAVADLMFGGERFITTINMSEFQEKHTVSRLIGSPPGYVGYGEGGVLTEAVRQRPYSVVLLDEVEKADPEVMNIFYQVFDKGMLADGEGRVIDFKNTVVFLTSNLATDVIMQMCAGPVPPTLDEVTGAIRPILSQHFKPALLARMEIVPFYPLARRFPEGDHPAQAEQGGRPSLGQPPHGPRDRSAGGGSHRRPVHGGRDGGPQHRSHHPADASPHALHRASGTDVGGPAPRPSPGHRG